MLPLRRATPRLDNTQKIALITFFSSLYFYSHVGTLYLQARGLNLLQVNSISSIIIGTIFLAEIPTGVLADRIGRKYSVVMAMILQLLGEVLYLFSRSYWAFVVIGVIAGVGFAFLSGAVEALIYDTLPKTDRDLAMKKAMGLKGLAFQVAFFLAPVTGSFLVPSFTMARFLFAVFLTACSVGVALAVAFTLEEPTKPYHHIEESSLEILHKGLREIRSQRRLQWLLLIGVLTATFSMSLTSLYQPYFAQFQITSFWMGITFAVGAMVAGLGERYVYKVEALLGVRWGFFTVTILPGIFYLLFAAASNVPLVMLFFVLTYGTTTLKDPLLSAYQNQLVAAENRATVLSLISLLGSLYIALMMLLMGWLADYRTHYAFVVSGSMIVVATIVLRVDKIGAFAKEESR